MSSNYSIMEEQARLLFLKYDLTELAGRWNLETDEQSVYVPYFGRRCTIRRSDGKVFLPAPENAQIREGTFGAALTIYDVLTYSSSRPVLSGRWESLSSIGGIIGAGHERSLTGDRSNLRLPPSVAHMKRALENMGAVPSGKTTADLDYIVPVFPFLPMRFQYWAPDEEFPASLKYLWDANTLQFLHYETLWYAMGDFDQMLAAAPDAAR